MGQNLSLEEPFADTAGAVFAKEDQMNSIILGIAWAGSVYGIGMIWCAVTLLSRWSGRESDRDPNLFSVLAAFLLSTGWPMIMLYFAMSSR
ncbi:uncharacterized protein PODANS_5_12040 [Podospora anserina S mat+]|uniref:Podospora anserina S mat+ genomic DNA chromosome 5, supercontig 7 n=6 Tax=Podospora TaxID=5144 RepID=B2AFM8_PODAN|nr:uncharacterized protein PODANS_5_12040 [Podospora anserina S mat+]KAK4642102.1 hypothetical protein QC761_512040 [Podospora bellae-mahoneyi]KAK4653291.1 hypothetical protein QC762_512040 [Podospora pseudocomata]KAK4664580.1 hypothetical protein QC763_512040 [Podospora pseudopauciseta]KAK4675727.1 hypothetical protein QC764_512040 [Podospora pseudoanserina]VBB81458.1 Putative protein of unknown function [Podospora comata]